MLYKSNYIPWISINFDFISVGNVFWEPPSIGDIGYCTFSYGPSGFFGFTGNDNTIDVSFGSLQHIVLNSKENYLSDWTRQIIICRWYEVKMMNISLNSIIRFENSNEIHQCCQKWMLANFNWINEKLIFYNLMVYP